MVDLNKFRIMYSELIEHYQYIEMHLKGIYACMNMDILPREDVSAFCDNLTDVNSDSLYYIMKKIREQEKTKERYVIEESFYNELEIIRAKRNYWCHSCFVDIVFDGKTGIPRKKHIDELLNDYREAERIRALLFEMKNRMLRGI